MPAVSLPPAFDRLLVAAPWSALRLLHPSHSSSRPAPARRTLRHRGPERKRVPGRGTPVRRHSGPVGSAAVRLVRSEDLAARAPYAYAAATQAAARLVVTASACPLDPSGATVAVGDVAGPAEQVMADLRTPPRAAGADLDRVVRTTVHVATSDRADLLAEVEAIAAAGLMPAS